MAARACLLGSLLPLLLAGLAVPADNPQSPEPSPIRWKKTALDRKFRSEGVAIADVNRDGKMDILAGEVWYEAPDWKMHEIKKPGDYGDGAHSYSQSFACWADDVNGDGWPDLIVIGFPGAPCHWYENPRGKTGHWKEHVITDSACNETPQYADLFGTGRRVLVMGWQPPDPNKPGQTTENQGQMCWFAPGKDPTKPWERHAISELSSPGHEVPGTFKFSHGLGVGDINGDGRPDVICTGGWWEQPARDDGKPWKFHPARDKEGHGDALGPACADMVVYDVKGDRKAAVISSSAHDYGMWWHGRKRGENGRPFWVRHDLFPRLVSETHALHCLDVNGDGLKDLVTGKRWWAHGPDGDVDPNVTPVLYWFEARREKDGMVQFIPHVIDKGSGVGTQFAVGDINGDGLVDIAVANKRGVFIFEQERDKSSARSSAAAGKRP